MSDVALETILDAEMAVELSRPCDAHGCTRQAVVAVRFHNQLGHVHDCAACAHDLREFCDVAESYPLPCPWPHNGATWTDTPRELR